MADALKLAKLSKVVSECTGPQNYQKADNGDWNESRGHQGKSKRTVAREAITPPIHIPQTPPLSLEVDEPVATELNIKGLKLFSIDHPTVLMKEYLSRKKQEH